jgi:hypothetical protein
MMPLRPVQKKHRRLSGMILVSLIPLQELMILQGM